MWCGVAWMTTCSLSCVSHHLPCLAGIAVAPSRSRGHGDTLKRRECASAVHRRRGDDERTPLHRMQWSPAEPRRAGATCRVICWISLRAGHAMRQKIVSTRAIGEKFPTQSGGLWHSPRHRCRQVHMAVHALRATSRPYTKLPDAKPCFMARKASRKCIKALPCCRANCHNLLFFTISNDISHVLAVCLLRSSDLTIESPLDFNRPA